MRKLSRYWQALYKSLSEPSFYVVIFRAPFWWSVRFYLLSLLLLTLIDTLYIRIHQVPIWTAQVKQEATALINQLPSEAAFSYNGQRLASSGFNPPFTLKATSDLENAGFPNNLIVINGEDKADSQAFLTITPFHLYSQASTGNNGMALNSIFDNNQWSLTREQLRSKAGETLQELSALATPALLLLLPFIYLGNLIAQLILLLILSLFASTVGWLLGIHMSLKKIFQLGLHAIVAASLFDFVAHVLFPVSNVSILVPAYLGIMVLVFLHFRSYSKMA